jgi:hypothetical protein
MTNTEVIKKLLMIAPDNLDEDKKNALFNLILQLSDERELTRTVPYISKETIKVIEKAKQGCLHCGETDKQIVGRGLCYLCYREFRDKYPTKRKGKRAKKKYNYYIKKPKNAQKEVSNNPKYASEMINCQYAKCPQPSNIYMRRDMVVFDDLFFCSNNCVDGFKGLNSDRGDGGGDGI